MVPQLGPNYISCDYELAIIRAIQHTYPDTTICGCFFHLCKNMKKHIGEQGLNRNYNNDANFALNAKMITSLAFVPINDIDIAVDALAEELPEELQPILQWFEDYYIGRVNRGRAGRRPPVFSHEMWSVYESITRRRQNEQLRRISPQTPSGRTFSGSSQ
ncbi:hypothetical protein PPYR_06443 [Photinus pyralis]|uniref:MULE transposase domain-containing protein n=1 Tax=Photinus pyralis TaxID=7054 RepID=A0A5N4ATN2_PHOPY|nr:hypothetical protein PPYR_06443 [Photinus pyralis]